jgi:hypothetical protein
LLVDIEGAERVWVNHRLDSRSRPRHRAGNPPAPPGLLETGAVVRAVLAEGFQLLAIEDNVIAFQR